MDEPALADIEAIVWGEPEGRKLELRLWLRLLSCANMISGEIRRNLRNEFDMTLPRFDLMAQLNREPDGLRLSELSKRMMVTNGNLTGLVDRLVSEGLVLREADPDDRRAFVVRLSKAGSAIFARIAATHEEWLVAMFGTAERKTLDRLMRDLDELKRSLRHNRAR